MSAPEIIECGTWSFAGGKERPAYVVAVEGRVWGSYCYRAVAEAAAARLTGRERVAHLPLLSEFTPWQA